MNEQIKEQYIISETADEQIKALQLLEKLGYKWQTGDKSTEIIPIEEHPDEKVIYLHLPHKTLSHSGINYMSTAIQIAKEIYEEITYEELLRQNKKVII